MIFLVFKVSGLGRNHMGGHFLKLSLGYQSNQKRQKYDDFGPKNSFFQKFTIFTYQVHSVYKLRLYFGQLETKISGID
jgi:hypothetical protein